MDIKTFKVERWMDDYETKCTYNLAETCIDSLTVREVVEMAGLDVAEYMNELADTRLTYSHIGGSPELLDGIASLYSEVIKPEHIMAMFSLIVRENRNGSCSTIPICLRSQSVLIRRMSTPPTVIVPLPSSRG